MKVALVFLATVIAYLSWSSVPPSAQEEQIISVSAAVIHARSKDDKNSAHQKRLLRKDLKGGAIIYDKSLKKRRTTDPTGKTKSGSESTR